MDTVGPSTLNLSHTFFHPKMESSRIFVRGLPPKFTEDDVRKHFSKYAVTDVKFFPHRRIGYVGYRTPEDAAKAVKYFNKSFIRMSKIFVEMARPVWIPTRPGWCRSANIEVRSLTRVFRNHTDRGKRRRPGRHMSTIFHRRRIMR